MEENELSVTARVQSRVPMTPTLEQLLRPDLFRREPIFTRPLTLPAESEKIYQLSEDEIRAIRERSRAIDAARFPFITAK